MAIPDYQTLMLPFLTLLADGQPRRIVPQVTDALVKRIDDANRKRQPAARSRWCSRSGR